MLALSLMIKDSLNLVQLSLAASTTINLLIQNKTKKRECSKVKTKKEKNKINK